jgi:hypothetical protein
MNVQVAGVFEMDKNITGVLYSKVFINTPHLLTVEL